MTSALHHIRSFEARVLVLDATRWCRTVMKDDTPLDAFHAHEVLHISGVVAEMFERLVEQHCYTQSNAALKAASEALSAQLHSFYQLVGGETLKELSPPASSH